MDAAVLYVMVAECAIADFADTKFPKKQVFARVGRLRMSCHAHDGD
jgi:hypothetical protein